MKRISIIVPVLNESRSLPFFLEYLASLDSKDHEIIFVDGGSQDSTTGLIETAGFRLLEAKRGRARQMNTGARAAAGEILLFLHADTRLPDNAAEHIKEALANALHCWGRFDVFIDGRACLLRLVGFMMNWRSRLTGIATGDQAIFVMAPSFWKAGGFPEQPLMEDIELSKHLLCLSRPACLRQRAVTSGRRWEQYGVWRTTILMWRLRWAYWRGVPAEQLANAYR